MRGVTYRGPDLAEPSRLAALPGPLVELLWQVNGFVAYAGGLHMRGLVDEPDWHSFERYHSGEMALHKLFRQVREYDIPFAQDFLGNQFLLRDGEVRRLRADTGEVKSLNVDLAGFMGEIRERPIEYLELDLLARFVEARGLLEPGLLVHAIPPLCVRTEDKKVELRSAPVENVISFLAAFARQVGDVPDGTTVNLKMFKPPDAD